MVLARMLLVWAVAAMSFWHDLVGDSHGLIFERGVHASMSRHELVDSFAEVAAQRAAAAAAIGISTIAEKEDGRSSRHQETDEEKMSRVLSDKYDSS